MNASSFVGNMILFAKRGLGMGSFKLFGTELRSLKERKGLLFALIGVMLIPIVYVAVLLSATWGPYDNLENLPVAFVNKDLGGVSSGQPINVGNDLVETLKDSKTLGWNFVTEEEANKGLESQKYYMIIEIPEDFSQKVTTVLDPNPQVPELRYIQNEGLNFMASQVTNSAVERLREQLGDKITATYARTVFSRFGDISDGFASGADGSQQIYDGTTQLADGTGQLLSSLTEKTGDIEKLATGAKTADAGAGEILSAINGGSGSIKKLADGSKAVVAGAGELKAGSTQVLGGLTAVQGGSKQVLGGLTTLETGSTQVLQGLKSASTGSEAIVAGLEKQLQPGLQQLAGGVGQASEAVAKLNAGSQALTAGLKKFVAANPTLAQSKEFLTLVGTSEAVSTGLGEFEKQVAPMQQGATALVAGATQLTEGSKELNAGLGQLVAGQTQAVGGLQQLVTGQKTAVAGIDQLVIGQSKLVAGAKSLESGASQVAAGNGTLTGSWSQLGAGVSNLKNGLSQISTGNQTVATGWATMTEGVTSLNDGTLKLQAGSSELITGLAGGAEEVSAIQVTDANIAMFSSPVTLTGEKVNSYTYYRDSTAPYILSLALFVGMLVLSFFVDFKKPAILPSSAISWFVSKWLQLALFAIIQAVLVSLFTLFVLQLDVQNVGLFIVFSILASITFMSIVFFLVSVGGNIGRFIALIFIVLQLSITGSNLPIPMLPENLRALSQFLPLTYSNAGFKSIISLGDMSLLASNVSVLAIYLVASSALALVAFIVGYKALTAKFKPEVESV